MGNLLNLHRQGATQHWAGLHTKGPRRVASLETRSAPRFLHRVPERDGGMTQAPQNALHSLETNGYSPIIYWVWGYDFSLGS